MSAISHLDYVEHCGDEWWFGFDATCLEPRCQALGFDNINRCCSPAYPGRGHSIVGRVAGDGVCSVGF